LRVIIRYLDADWLKEISKETNISELFAGLDQLIQDLGSYFTGENLEDVTLRAVVLDSLGEQETDWLFEYQSVYASCQKDPSLNLMSMIYSPSTSSSDDSFN
jgi:hypothetical protein